MKTRPSPFVYPRLCIAYFCQLAIWGAWANALGGYADRVLNFSGGEIGSLYNAIPFGALIAPLLIGPIADRYFSSQKVLSVLHIIGGLALLACGWLCLTGQQNFPLLMTLMLISGICYMPSIGIMNSIVFKQLPNPSKAPLVFVFGSIGWIIVNLVIAAFGGGAETPFFFFIAGGIGVFLSFYVLTLPDTPPVGAPVQGKSSGPGLMSLFKSFPFVIFVACAFLVSIPAFNYFFPAQVSFLTERGYPSPVALTTISPMAEILVMLALPFLIPRIGLKNVLLLGMGAWTVRYFLFAEPSFVLAIIGLLLHAFCYTCLTIAAYMYAEKVAPAHLKASAQTMMVFLLLGVAQVLGGYWYGFMSEKYSATWRETSVVQSQLEVMDGKIPNVEFDAKVPIPVWNLTEDSPFQHLDFAWQVNRLIGREAAVSDVRAIDLGNLLEGRPLTPQAIAEMDESLLVQDGVRITQMTIDGVRMQIVGDAITANVAYTKETLTALAAGIAGTDDFSLTRDDWLAAQARNWQQIFRIPAFFMLIWFVVFLVFGRNPDDKEEKEKEPVE